MASHSVCYADLVHAGMHDAQLSFHLGDPNFRGLWRLMHCIKHCSYTLIIWEVQLCLLSQ